MTKTIRSAAVAALGAVTLIMGGVSGASALASPHTVHASTHRISCTQSVGGEEGLNPDFETYWTANTCGRSQQVAGKCKAYKSPATVWVHGVWRTGLGSNRASQANCNDSVSFPVQMNLNVSSNGGRTYQYCELWPDNDCNV